MNRTANVVRMQLINRTTFIWAPLLVMGAAFAVTLAIYGIVIYAAGSPDDPMYGGGIQAPLWYLAAVGVQAMALTFPFSQAMSVTRRDFFLGTVATAAATALGLALIVLIGGLIEGATDGWGFNGYFFRLPWIWQQGPIVATFLFFTAALSIFLVGFLGATIYKRFGLTWTIAAGIGLVGAVALAAFLITFFDGWPAFGRLLTGAQPVWIALVVAGIGALAGGASYLILRRSIP